MYNHHMDRKHWFIVLCFLIIPPIGLIDQVTGTDLSLIPFYFPPLVAISWYGGLGAGIIGTIVASATWAVANIAFPSQTDLPQAAMIGWSLIEKLIFFSLVASAVVKLHDLLDRESRRAMTDYVTALPNRRAFTAAMRETLAIQLPFSLAFVELDGLEDLYLDRGEIFVDRLLAEMAKVCRRLRCYRYSDRRLAVILPEIDGPTAVKRMSSLMEALDGEVLGGRGLGIKFKVGIAFCQDSSKISIPALLRFLAGRMVYLHEKSGDQLEFFQFA